MNNNSTDTGAANQAAITNDTTLPRMAFNIYETAQILGLHHNSVRRLIVRGELRASRKLRHLMIPKFEIERFLKASLN